MAFNRGNSSMTREEYQAYLQSPEWKALRCLAIDSAGGRCRLCNSTDSIEVHHRNYERLGHEELDDLTVLCARCHHNFHVVVATVEGNHKRLSAEYERGFLAGREHQSGNCCGDSCGFCMIYVHYSAGYQNGYLTGLNHGKSQNGE